MEERSIRQCKRSVGLLVSAPSSHCTIETMSTPAKAVNASMSVILKMDGVPRLRFGFSKQKGLFWLCNSVQHSTHLNAMQVPVFTASDYIRSSVANPYSSGGNSPLRARPRAEPPVAAQGIAYRRVACTVVPALLNLTANASPVRLIYYVVRFGENYVDRYNIRSQLAHKHVHTVRPFRTRAQVQQPQAPLLGA